MQMLLEFEERTGLISSKGRIGFSFVKPYVSVAAMIGATPPLPNDFSEWDLAQGFFHSADSAPVMVTLQVDATDPKKANVIAQQKGGDFSGRNLHAPNGLSVGSPIDVFYPGLPPATGPAKFVVTLCRWN